MARHLFPQAVFVTVGSAIAPDHNGVDYENTDCPTGSFLCQDKDGEWYIHNHPCYADAEVPFPTQLFRDSWSILPHDFETTDAPYYAAIRNAPRVPCTIMDLEDE